MNIVVLAVMAILTGLFLRELAVVLRARVPTQTRAVIVGEGAPACTDEIPRILWTYCQQAPVPPFIQACLDNWRRFAPDHQVRVLDRSALVHWLPTVRDDFDALPADRQSDWLRVQLLARHGGVWMDAGTLLSRDLAWLHDTRRRRAADYLGFYLDRDTTRPELPVVEPGLMASVRGGAFITALAGVLDHALDEGAGVLLQRLRDEGRHARVVQAMPQATDPTLSLPLMASELLDREPQIARLVLLRAEDGPLAWQAGVGWRAHHLYARLALVPCPRVLPAVLELRSNDLAVVSRNWRRLLVSPFSALVQLVERKR